MAYQIEYAYTCHIGKIRNNNEDNFWCCGEYLEEQNQGMSHIRNGRTKQIGLPLFAVFDGMGGESCGETAAFLTARKCGEYYDSHKKKMQSEPKEALEELCEEMNRVVCSYGKENKITSMGTTAAMLFFDKEYIYGCNLGDSRIYRFTGERFYQISEDHVLGRRRFGKAPLTQYVGIMEENLKLEPSISKQEAVIGDRFLICSDGITDMLLDGEIADILSRELTVEETVEVLVERALKKGGKDNITVILCEVKEQEQNWFQRLIRKFHGRYEGDVK